MIPWLKGLLADPNGVPDDGRLAALLIVLSYIGNSAYALHLGQVWNPQDYGIGAGAVLAGAGGLFKLRAGN